MPDEADPPRKVHTFKPKVFDVVNPPVSRPEADTGERSSADGRATTGGNDVRDHCKSAAGDPQRRVLSSPAAAIPRTDNDVQMMLKTNLAQANAAGLTDLVPKARKSKRRRDYWVTMLVANPVMCALFGFALYQRNPFLLAYAGAALVLFNVSFTWVMWFVMDDY